MSPPQERCTECYGGCEFPVVGAMEAEAEQDWEHGWEGAADLLLEFLALVWIPVVLYRLFKSWKVLPGSDFSPSCSCLLAFLFRRVSVTLALTARVRGEAEEVLKEENQFHSVLVPSFSIRFR